MKLRLLVAGTLSVIGLLSPAKAETHIYTASQNHDYQNTLINIRQDLMEQLGDRHSTQVVAGVETLIKNSSSNSRSIHVASESPYIGQRYVGDPGNVESLGGWTVGDPSFTPFYSVSHVQRGSQQMLWLEVAHSRDSSGRPLNEVLDVLNLPSMDSSEQIASSGSCQRNGTSDPNLIAIAIYEDEEVWTQITHAWRTNIATGRFEETSTQGITCENPGWGV